MACVVFGMHDREEMIPMLLKEYERFQEDYPEKSTNRDRFWLCISCMVCWIEHFDDWQNPLRRTNLLFFTTYIAFQNTNRNNPEGCLSRKASGKSSVFPQKSIPIFLITGASGNPVRFTTLKETFLPEQKSFLPVDYHGLNNDPAKMDEIIADILAVDTGNDFVIFKSGKTEPIALQRKYHGVGLMTAAIVKIPNIHI